MSGTVQHGEEHELGHISLVRLWAYRTYRQQLSSDELWHLTACGDCLSLLGLCQISESVKEVEQRLASRPAVSA